MDKQTPHYPLEMVKNLVRANKVRITNTALSGAHLLDLEIHDVWDIVLSLARDDFYKSMTTYSDHREWQDVYRPNTNVGRIYLKLTIRDGVLILSFKELYND